MPELTQLKTSAAWTGVALALPLCGTAYAQQPDMEGWSTMQAEVISAEELIEGDVTNGFNPVGQVSNLVLSEDRSRVEYILYEVPYPYSNFGGEDGFAAFDNVEITRGLGFDLEVRFEDEETPQAPERLTLTAEQAQERLVTRLMDEPLQFSQDAARPIEDLLIDRETGEILFYVVEMTEDTLFSLDRRAVPAEQVSIGEQGEVTATIELAALDEMQHYDTELL